MVGVTIAKVDGGFFLDLTAFPNPLDNPDIRMTNYAFVRDHACETLNGIVKCFVTKIKALPIKDKRRPTIQKTSVSSLANMNILEQDQEFILSLLDRCISETITSHIKIVRTLQKFGRKSQNDLA